MPAEPQATQSIRDGHIGVIRDYEVYPDHQISVLLYSGNFVKNKPEAARRFMKAFLRGVRDHEDSLVDGKFSGAKGEAIIAILTEFGPIKNPEVYRSFVLSTCPPNGEINLASLKEDYAVFQKGDLLKGTVTVEQTIDPTFVDWAVKEYRVGANQVDEQGFLPNELKRKQRALAYHNYALPPLTMIASFAQVNGVDVRGENNNALQRLAQRVLNGSKDPSAFKARNGEKQDMKDLKIDSKYSWMEPYCSLYACSGDTLQRKRGMQPFNSFRLGGDLTRVYDPSAESKK